MKFHIEIDAYLEAKDIEDCMIKLVQKFRQDVEEMIGETTLDEEIIQFLPTSTVQIGPSS